MGKARTQASGIFGLGLPRGKAAMVLVAVALACCARLAALDPSLDISQYAHTAWRVRDGFTRGTISSIAQTPDGYLWLGTEFGLVRFDGVREISRQPPGDQHLPSDVISSLLVTHDGTFWIGTRSGLASWKDDKLTIYPEMAGQQVGHLLEDHEGTVWVGGLRIPNEAKLCAIGRSGIDCQGGDGRFGSGVYSVYEGSKANLWVGVAAGFWRWKPGPPRFFSVPTESSGIRGFAEDDQGALLVPLTSGIGRFVDGRIERSVFPGPNQSPGFGLMFRHRDRALML